MERRDSGVKIFLRNFSSTGLPNIAGIILSAPIERYSIICQTRSLLKSPLGYPTFKSYITQVPNREGLLGLFRGSIVRSFHYFFGSAITFRSFYYLKGKFEPNENSTLLESQFLNILSNFTIFLTTELFVYNYERARTLVACDFKSKDVPRTYNGSFEVFSHSIRTGGLKSLYSGFPLYLGSYGFFLSVTFGVFKIFEELEVKSEKAVDFAAFGIARAIVYPLDLLRRRRQVSGTEYFQKDHGQFYKQIQEITKNEGAKGLYRGFLPAMIHTFTCLNLIQLFSGDTFFKAD